MCPQYTARKTKQQRIRNMIYKNKKKIPYYLRQKEKKKNMKRTQGKKLLQG